MEDEDAVVDHADSSTFRPGELLRSYAHQIVNLPQIQLCRCDLTLSGYDGGEQIGITKEALGTA